MFADVESLRTLNETAVPAVVPEGCVSVAVGSKSPPAVVHASAPFRVFQVTPASVQSVNPVMRWISWLRLRKGGVVRTRLSVEVFRAVLGVSPVVLRSKRTKRSEEHTSELQSLTNLVCRLLLEKKKNAMSGQAV